MKILYFPGNGVVNKSELESFGAMFTKNGMDFHAHEWAHWTDESLEFDTARELESLKQHIDMNEQEYILLGKSIGTYFVCEVIKNFNIKPKKVILMGIPTGMEKDRMDLYKEVLSSVNSEITVIQNEKDPYGALDEVKKVLEGVTYKLTTMPTDTHIYQYTNEVKEMLN